jgi:hypothetical protein
LGRQKGACGAVKAERFISLNMMVNGVAGAFLPLSETVSYLISSFLEGGKK